MQLTVLGRYSPFPPSDGACPGYLVQGGGESLLLECGSGVVARLQRHLPLAGLRYVILSHLHGDHCSDMNVLRYAADTDVRHRQAPDPVEVFAPPEPEDEFARLEYKDAVAARPVNHGDRLQLGPFSVEFARTDHPLHCLAVRVTADGKSLVYTGDTAFSPEVTALAADCDLLLAEASLEESRRGFRGHMTASEAARMACEAGARRLLLTHFWPFSDPEAMADTARLHCDLPCTAVAEGETYLV